MAKSRRHAPQLFVLSVGIGLGLAVTRAGDDPVPPPQRVGAPPPLTCLEKPDHWSKTPEFTPGLVPLLSRYVRFTTKEGRVIDARVYLLELRPELANMPPNVPRERRARISAVPRRLLCQGHEISTDEDFVPEFVIPRGQVSGKGCTFRFPLGDVTCTVRTTAAPADDGEVP